MHSRGKHLGPIGSYIVADAILGAFGSRRRFLSSGSCWEPTLAVAAATR